MTGAPDPTGLPPDPTRRPVRRRKPFPAVTGVVALIVAMPFFLLFQDPPHWPGADPGDPEVSLRAQNLENRLVSEFSRVRDPDAEWSFALNSDEWDAWLATRLKPWLENRRLAAEHAPRLLRACARLTSRGVQTSVQADRFAWNRPLTLDWQLEETDGPLRLRARNATLGRLPVPLSLLPRAASGGSAGDPLSLAWPLGDGRRVEMVGFRMADHRIEFLCRTRRPIAASER